MPIHHDSCNNGTTNKETILCNSDFKINKLMKYLVLFLHLQSVLYLTLHIKKNSYRFSYRQNAQSSPLFISEASTHREVAVYSICLKTIVILMFLLNCCIQALDL